MEFPPPHVHPPQSSHTHTIILLHGRGSDGLEFAEELFSSATTQGKSLASCLPTYRWVFPTSRDRWSTTFQEELCSWFDAYSLNDIHGRQELQRDGLKESVWHVLDILDREAKLLDGRLTHIYLGGISQGMATALWTFFAAIAMGRIQGPLGGLLGFCGWLPFAQQLEDLLPEQSLDSASILQTQRLISGFFLDEIAGPEISVANQPVDSSVLATPVFLSHGADDVWVSVELGRQASRILRRVVPRVEWHEFTGAEGDGHWIKEPDGFDQILQFLET
ncbi:uncharacterized protein N7459_005518 [Penicillium hispanicum]|uniref:uncharacterized protein n=1 Tax=Penicillium hispanicum TaxID=1080232 RepID=UPI0025416A7D|nr:uncharacterized protein N7459_005518 [Penicillium hispanicum]KAJ5579533.1 hypothetical protein N7459_005518 [Penicillium hispanicum]